MKIRGVLLLLALCCALAGGWAEVDVPGPPVLSPPPGPGGVRSRARGVARGAGRGHWLRVAEEGVPAPKPSLCVRASCPPPGFAPYPPTVGFYHPHHAPAPWPLAKERCSEFDAYLVQPNSQMEFKVLLELMKINNLTTIHVGFFKGEDDYFSVLGKKMGAKEEALWDPARRVAEDDAQCVALSAEGLAASPCDAHLPFICEL